MSAPHQLRETAKILRALRVEDELLFERALATCTDEELEALGRTWELTARPKQLRPDDCHPLWLRCAGRFEGKTRSGAEETLNVCEDYGPMTRGVLCSKTIADAHDVMVEGESGILACAERRGTKVEYEKYKKITHESGAVLYLLTAEKPEKPRGYQSSWLWLDEIAAWEKNPIRTFDNLVFGWRLCFCGRRQRHRGRPCPVRDPAGIITTTPRPSPIMLRLMRDRAWADKVTVTAGKSRENAANVSHQTLGFLEDAYGNSRWAAQELDGILLDELALLEPGAVDKHRETAPDPDSLVEIVVAVDPSIDDEETSDACGVCVAARDTRGHVLVLHSEAIQGVRGKVWGRRVVELAIEFGATQIIAERNQGGKGIDEILETAMTLIADEGVALPLGPGDIRGVWHNLSKRVRAQPCATKVEQGRVHFIDHHPQLELELATWSETGPSPNVLDAWAMAVSALFWPDVPRIGPLTGGF